MSKNEQSGTKITKTAATVLSSTKSSPMASSWPAAR